jgi:hypothetical protein
MGLDEVTNLLLHQTISVFRLHCVLSNLQAELVVALIVLLLLLLRLFAVFYILHVDSQLTLVLMAQLLH